METADTSVSASISEAHLAEPPIHLPVYSQGAQNAGILPRSESLSGSTASHKIDTNECGGAGKVRDVGIADQPVVSLSANIVVLLQILLAPYAPSVW